MFNGIVTHTGKINKIYIKNNNCILSIYSKVNFKKKEIGSSISCSGACLTLVSFKNNISNYYLSKETLKRTIFKYSKKNDLINIEKSLKFGDGISGHFVQGHVDLISQVIKIDKVGKSWLINFRLPKLYKEYLVKKGSIAINGVSLTIVKILKNGFQISIIPHTLKFTNLINNIHLIINIIYKILVTSLYSNN